MFIITWASSMPQNVVQREIGSMFCETKHFLKFYGLQFSDVWQVLSWQYCQNHDVASDLCKHENDWHPSHFNSVFGKYTSSTNGNFWVNKGNPVIVNWRENCRNCSPCSLSFSPFHYVMAKIVTTMQLAWHAESCTLYGGSYGHKS